MLAALRGLGMRLGIATNDSIASTTRHLTQLGVLETFDAVICADTVAVPKPAGNMIREFARATGLSPHEIMMIGDNHHDMHEGRNGGAGARVAVLSGNSSRAELADHADHILKDVGELPALLESLRVL
jgi:phosphoglycolate phosphatase